MRFPRTRSILLLVTLGLLALVPPARAQSPSDFDSNPDAYRHFLLPTAKPITGGYAGFWELAFLQGGVGFDSVLSLSAGFTVMPTVAFRSQFGFIQAKLTFFDEGGLSFAAGDNLLRLTSEHLYDHIFGVLTYETEGHSRFTGLLMYKLSGDDFPIVQVAPYGSFAFSYGGPLGAALGFDTPLPTTRNMRFIAEAWSHDISTGGNKIAVLAALRVGSERFSSDFGFMYFAVPLLAPVANFVWRF